MHVEEMLMSLSLGELAKLYNSFENNKVKPVNRFSDRPSALKRILETATPEELSALVEPSKPSVSLFDSLPKPEHDPIPVPVPPVPDPSAEEDSEVIVGEHVAGNPEEPLRKAKAAAKAEPVAVTEVHFRRALHVRGKQIPLKKTESIRYKSFELLCRPEGATVAELEQIFLAADQKRGRTPRNTKNRIRDMLSILNQNYGYSIETRKDGSFKINVE